MINFLLYRPTWLEIDLKAIVYNFKRAKSIVGPKVKILAVVKSDAYGHGIKEVSRSLSKNGADYFGVACINEALQLRKTGIKKPILIFESIDVKYASEVVNNNLTVTISTLSLAYKISSYAKKRKKTAKVHVKIDTGMGRLGIWYEQALDFIKEIYVLPNLRIEGVYTHFPSADTDRSFTNSQIRRFRKLKSNIELNGIDIPLYHAANSMAVISFKNSYVDLVRPGLMLYGIYPKKGLTGKVKLKPAMKFKTQVMYVKTVPPGRGISYGRSFITNKKTTIATLPVGYNDGYFRAFSNKAKVLINGKRCKVVGRVCMDQIMVEIDKKNKVKINDVATLFGKDGKHHISAEELSGLADTIPYEIVCSAGKTQNRIFK